MSRKSIRVRMARTRQMILYIAAILTVAFLALAGVSPASAATNTVTYWNGEPAVNGTSVTLQASIGSTPRSTTVKNLALCVRDASGNNLDFPSVNNGGNVVAPTGTNGYWWSNTGTFAAGTYTWGICYQIGTAWYGQPLSGSSAKTFTVAATSTPPTTTNPIGPLTSAPSGNVPGYTQLWKEDFTQDSPAGSVGTDYADRLWLTADEQPGTEGVGVYENSRNLSVHDGVMDMTERLTADGTNTSGAQVRFLNDVNGAWAYSGGRFEIRMKAAFNEDNLYGVCNLLWPASEVWNEGEVDFPEGSLGGSADLNQHMLAPNDPSQVSLHGSVADGFQSWHVWTIDWQPGQFIKYYFDGVLFATETNPANIPTTEHSWILQALNVADADIPASTVAHVYVDYATAYAPAA